MEGLCGITTGGKKDQSQDELVGPLGSNPVKKKGSWVSVTDDSVKSSEEYFQRFDSMRLRAIENRQRDLESRLERLEKMML
jgi:hypothetical protein